jgi:DNA-binding NtrC family response regulator
MSSGESTCEMQEPQIHGRKRVLIAEDQAVIAMMMEQELIEAGYDVVGPFESCAEASAWLAHETPDMAILDVQLKDGSCTELAIELQKRGVRFTVFSGGKQLDGPAAFAWVPWFEKPSELSNIIASFSRPQANRAASEVVNGRESRDPGD